MIVQVDARDPVVVVSPVGEPVSVGEALTHLRSSGEGEVDWVKRTITAARVWVEGFTQRSLMTQTLEWGMDAWPARTLALPRPPLQAVVSVSYVDADGVEQTLPAGAYMVDTRSSPGRLRLRPDLEWPAVQAESLGGIVFRYRAGYGDKGEDVPADITSAMLMLIGHLYENRETSISGTIITLVPMGVEQLLWPYRVF